MRSNVLNLKPKIEEKEIRELMAKGFKFPTQEETEENSKRLAESIKELEAVFAKLKDRK